MTWRAGPTESSPATAAHVTLTIRDQDGTQSIPVHVVENQAIVVVGQYWIRCLPHDFPGATQRADQVDHIQTRTAAPGGSAAPFTPRFALRTGRAILAAQIDTKLHKRAGKALTNFSSTLPPARSDMAQQALKDRYVFDFLTLGPEAQERDLERGLVAHLRDFLGPAAPRRAASARRSPCARAALSSPARAG